MVQINLSVHFAKGKLDEFLPTEIYELFSGETILENFSIVATDTHVFRFLCLPRPDERRPFILVKKKKKKD